MTTDEIRYFLAVYDSKSLARAAASLNISSQGLGKAIARLEAKLGTPLFSRTTTGVKPTEAAVLICEHLKTIVAEEDAVLSLLAGMRAKPVEQRLLGRDSNLGDVIRRGVEEYNERYGQQIATDYTRRSEAEQARTFVEDGFDYRFLSVELDTLPHLLREPLCVLHYTPVVSSADPLAHKGAISLDDLRNRTVLAESVAYAHTQLLLKLCRDAGFVPKCREVDKTYIWKLLSETPEYVFFIKASEATGFPWTSSAYAVVSMDPPLDTQVVLQTTHDEMDMRLVACIRDALAQAQFE